MEAICHKVYAICHKVYVTVLLFKSVENVSYWKCFIVFSRRTKKYFQYFISTTPNSNDNRFYMERMHNPAKMYMLAWSATMEMKNNQWEDNPINITPKCDHIQSWWVECWLIGCPLLEHVSLPTRTGRTIIGISPRYHAGMSVCGAL